MLEEVGAPYDTEILDYASTMKAEPYLSINPMGKVPAIKHKGKVVTEVAAICCYLADAFPEADLAPPPTSAPTITAGSSSPPDRSKQAFSNKAAGWEPTPERQRMFGYGNYDLAIGTLEKALTGREYIAADHFTAADLFVGANVNFMLAFNLLEPKPAFVDYARRMTDREAYRRAKEIDSKLIAEAQAQQPQPA